MKSDYLDYIFNMKEYVYPMEDAGYAREVGRTGDEQMHIADVISLIKKSDKYRLFIDSMDGIDESILYQSPIHGVRHNERVAIFAAAIGIQQNLGEEDIKLLLEAAKYHDIGREDDSEDDFHGKRSVELIDSKGIGIDLSEESQKILKAICAGHSMEDEKLEGIMQEFGIQDKERCKKLFAILKDADALDRVRLKSDRLDPSYLRTEESKKMVLAAYETLHSYARIEHELEEEKNIELPNVMIYKKMPLSEEQLDYLKKRWRIFQRVSKFKPETRGVKTNADGEIVFPEGTLIHGTGRFSEKVCESISKTGVLAGEFFGEAEDGETYYCADFIRIPHEQTLSELQKSGIASAGGRIPLGTNVDSLDIAFIVEPSPMVDEVLEGDAYSDQCDEIAKSFLNKKSSVVQTFTGERKGEAAAVVNGVPASCITGIVVGKRIEENDQVIEFLKKTFPGRYIVDGDGIIIHDPTRQEGNEELQKKAVKLEMENSRLKREKKNDESRIKYFQTESRKKDEKIDRIIEVLREKGDIETLEWIYSEIIPWNDGGPEWLQEMKRKREEQFSVTPGEIREATSDVSTKEKYEAQRTERRGENSPDKDSGKQPKDSNGTKEGGRAPNDD